MKKFLLLVVVLLMLLTQDISYAEQLGVKTGRNNLVDKSNSIYGAELILDYEKVECLNFRLDFDQFFADTKMFAVSPSIMLKTKGQFLDSYMGIGAVLVVEDKGHGIGNTLFIGVEPKINESVSVFTEVKFNFLKTDKADWDSVSMILGVRFNIGGEDD